MSAQPLFAMVPEPVWMTFPARQRVLCFIMQRSTKGCGLWFGRQSKIADELGLSKTTVRNALQANEADGLIVSRTTHDGDGYLGFKMYAVVAAVEGDLDAAFETLARKHRLNLMHPKQDETPGRKEEPESGSTVELESGSTVELESGSTVEDLEVLDLQDLDLRKRDHSPSEHDRSTEQDDLKPPPDFKSLVKRATAYRINLKNSLNDTPFDDPEPERVRWAIAGVFAFLWLTGIEGEQRPRLNGVLPAGASKEDWYSACSEIAGCLDAPNMSEGHECREELLGLSNPHSWSWGSVRDWMEDVA